MSDRTTERVAVKEILVFFQSKSVDMLIPKVRGSGFRTVPLGHHDCPLSRLAYKIGYDIYGLDGALEVQTGYINFDDRDRIIEKAVRPIAEFLGVPWRVVNASEYWASHPVKTGRGTKHT